MTIPAPDPDRDTRRDADLALIFARRSMIRDAAALARAAAANLDHHRWATGQHGLAAREVTTTDGLHLIGHIYYRGADRHVALWDPATARAVADLLDAIVDSYDHATRSLHLHPHDAIRMTSGWDQAVDLARTFTLAHGEPR